MLTVFGLGMMKWAGGGEGGGAAFEAAAGGGGGGQGRRGRGGQEERGGEGGGCFLRGDPGWRNGCHVLKGREGRLPLHPPSNKPNPSPLPTPPVKHRRRQNDDHRVSKLVAPVWQETKDLARRAQVTNAVRMRMNEWVGVWRGGHSYGFSWVEGGARLRVCVCVSLSVDDGPDEGRCVCVSLRPWIVGWFLYHSVGMPTNKRASFIMKTNRRWSATRRSGAWPSGRRAIG